MKLLGLEMARLFLLGCVAFLILIGFYEDGFAVTDVEAPVLLSVTLDQDTVDVSAAPQTIIFTLEASDESPISDVEILLRSPGGANKSSRSRSGSLIHEFTFTSDEPSGEWPIVFIALTDSLGNQKVYTSSLLGTLSVPSTITVLDDGSCRTGCFNFDVDENLEAEPLTDGLLVIRHLFGFSGDALISDAVAVGANRESSEAISKYLTEGDLELDIDGNGKAEPLTDGLLLMRYLYEFSGDSLIKGAIGAGATRDTAEEVEAYIKERVPTD